MYKLYTLPSCVVCQKVKKFLDQKRVDYQEVNIGIGDGRREFQRFYIERKDLIERVSGQIILPILFDGNKVIQGKDNIINHL